VFEDRALKRIFGPEGDEATENWRKLKIIISIIYSLYVLLLE
jgi:hypothetical protein